MDLSKLPLFSLISQRMSWLTDRQRVLAQNVANVDTPGYLPSDVKAPDFRQMLGATRGRLQPAQTDGRHLASTGGGAPSGARQIKPAEKSISGNAVSLDQELMKVSETAADYQLITNLYRKQIGMLRTVLGRGSS